MKHHNFTNFLVGTLLLIFLGPLYTSLSHAGLSDAGTITDNFDGAAINHRLWQPFFNDNPQQAFVQQAGELRLQINGQEFNTGVNGKFLLKGDFTMVVGYALINWPTANDVSLGFECGGRGENSNVELGIRRLYSLMKHQSQGNSMVPSFVTVQPSIILRFQVWSGAAD